jgi:hypothetical protein
LSAFLSIFQANCGPSLSKQFLPILNKTSAQPAFPSDNFCGQEIENEDHVEPF